MTPIANDTGLTQDLIDRGMKLSPTERQKFAHLLLDSVNVEDDEGYTEEELQDELTRRLEEYQRGEAQTYSLEEVMSALRSQAEKRKT